MAVISTTADIDFNVTATGDFRFKVKSGKARLYVKNADASYSIVGDVPTGPLASGTAIVSNTVSSAYKWSALVAGTTVEVEQ